LYSRCRSDQCCPEKFRVTTRSRRANTTDFLVRQTAHFVFRNTGTVLTFGLRIGLFVGFLSFDLPRFRSCFFVVPAGLLTSIFGETPIVRILRFVHPALSVSILTAKCRVSAGEIPSRGKGARPLPMGNLG
jgi:hypothetical protein